MNLALLVKGWVLCDVQHASLDELRHLPPLRRRQALARPAHRRRLVAHLSAHLEQQLSTNVFISKRKGPFKLTQYPLEALK